MLAEIAYDPIVRVHLGPLSISPHGVFTAIGFLVGARLLLGDTRRRAIADDVMYAILTRAAIGAAIGARTVYVINHWSNYENPLEWFRIWEGGISLLGGIAGALVAATPLVRRHGLRFFPLMDLAAPWLALGIAIGRIGDLIIADHLGEPTTMPLVFRGPDVVDVGRTVGSPCPPGATVHLTAAYDMSIALVVAAVLICMRTRLLRTGARTLLFGILYGAGRFAFDFLRADDRRLGLTGSQWTALVVAVIASGILLRRRRDDALPLVATGIPTVAASPEEASRGATSSNR